MQAWDGGICMEMDLESVTGKRWGWVAGERRRQVWGGEPRRRHGVGKEESGK
jgi:hypothetical protein